MASNGNSSSPADEEEGAVGYTPRQRKSSDGSLSSEETTEQGKRIRTGHGFVIPGVVSSPPSFVSLEEIMKAAKGMNNMVLAHEIAFDKDFKLEKFDPPENSIQKIVKDTIHKAFWDLLISQLNEDPPNYSQALILLAEVRENLLSILLPQHTKLKQEILEVLDSNLIQQQVQEGTLNFKEYAHYVISLMGKMCAPARDARIQELTQMTEIVDVFKGILETLDLMKLDMANFAIKVIRPNIIASSVEYEKQKFADFLKVQVDGLAITQQWLLKHLVVEELASSPEEPTQGLAYVNKLTERILAKAYLDLLEWKADDPFPETVAMDEARFRELGISAFRLAIMGAVLLVTVSCNTALQSITSFKQKLKEDMSVLLAEIEGDWDLEPILQNVAAQVIKVANDFLTVHDLKMLDDNGIKILTKQIISIGRPDHKIKQLVRIRIQEFLQQTITSPTAAPVRVPAGLSSLQAELTVITGHFLRLVSHNRAVFSQYYVDIVQAALGIQ